MKGKKAFILVLAFSCGFLAALLWVSEKGVTVSAQCPDNPPHEPKANADCNGDVNGDGAIDLADAIYLLQFLFANGPVPVPIQCDCNDPYELPAPRAYFSFNNADDPAHDDSSNGNDGIVLGPIYSDGSLYFDGNGYVDIGAKPGLRISGDLTVTAWVRAEPAVYGQRFSNIISRQGWSRDRHWCWGLRLNHGRPECWISASGTYPINQLTSTIEVDAALHHIAMAYEPQRSIRLYVDGSVVSERLESVLGGIADPAEVPIYIGAAYYSVSFDTFFGSIDDVRIYAQALSPRQISAIIDLGRP